MISQACRPLTGGWDAARFAGSSGSKGAKKLDRASPVGLHKQIGLNCTGCGPSTAGRATTVPMARQRSERQKPRNTYDRLHQRDGVEAQKSNQRRQGSSILAAGFSKRPEKGLAPTPHLPHCTG